MADKAECSGIAVSRRAIYWRIGIITVGANLLFVGLAGFALHQSLQRYEDVARFSTQALSRVFSEQIADSIEKLDLAVLSIVDEAQKQLAEGGMNSPKMNSFIAHWQKRLVVADGLRMTNAAGDNTCGSASERGLQTNVADRSYFQRLRQDPNAGLIISEAVVGKVSKKWILVFARRYTNPDGSFAGVVYGTMFLKQFCRAFSAIDSGKGATLALRDERLALLIRYPEPENLDSAIGKENASPELSAAVRQRDNGVYRSANAFDKVDRIYSFHKIPDRPFYVIAGQAYQEILSPWRAEAFWICSLMLLFVVGSLVSARVVYQAWQRNVKALEALSCEQQALRKSQSRLTEAQCLARVGNWELDLIGNKPVWSEEMFRIFEVDRGKFGETFEAFLDVVHPEDRSIVKAAFEASPQTPGTLHKNSYRLQMSDGRVKYVQQQCETFVDDRGKPVRVVGIVQDVTERRQADLEREKLEEQLRQSQKMESVGRLAGGVAHDFNNMLSVILGHVDLAMAKVDPAGTIYTSLREIRTAARHSADLTTQLLAFARKQTVTPKVIDLNQVVEGSLQLLQRIIGENVNLVWHPCSGLWPVKIDPAQVGQILTNLCINSRHAIADVGTITIETSNEDVDESLCRVHPGVVAGEYVRMVVRDTGCGMDDETLAHIFEPFFTTKGQGKGTGLGLAMVYGAITQNRGFIIAASKVNQGTTITIYLPRHVGEPLPSRAEEASPAQTGRQGRETILLVEDEPAVLKMTAAMLDGMGYRVLTAGLPDEALRLAREHVREIRLLMTDVIMPAMNGQELAHKLQSFCPGLRQLFMSGYTADTITSQGMLDAGVFFIQKPFSIDELSAKIRQVLDQK